MTALAHPASWLTGYIPDLPTPFDENGGIDLAVFAKLCERQIEAGVSAIVVAETRGRGFHPGAGRTRQHRPRRRRDRAWPGPRYRRSGIELNQPGNRIDAASRSGGRRCRAFGRTLLQQADAGRH
jgi:hypothetical protein